MAPRKPMHRMVAEYCNSVGKYGPDSKEARKVRETYIGNKEFVAYADAVDRIKRCLGGSGIDWHPANN